MLAAATLVVGEHEPGALAPLQRRTDNSLHVFGRHPVTSGVALLPGKAPRETKARLRANEPTFESNRREIVAFEGHLSAKVDKEDHVGRRKLGRRLVREERS